jgi:hypothetical protein
MRQRVIVTLIALLALIASLAGGIHAASAATASTGSMEQDFVARINALRASKGVGPLSVDSELTGIGRRWAGRMAAAGSISHNPNFPNEVTANWTKLGENVGMGPDVASIHNAFVNSSHHYVNMVDPAFTRIGVGVVVASDGTIFTSHQFERLASDDAAAAPKTAAPAPAPRVSAPRTARQAAPRAAAAPKPAAAVPASPVAVAKVAAAPAPNVVPARMAMSLEQTRSL